MPHQYTVGTPEERFWPKVNKTDGCWLWTGAIIKRLGYGRFWYKNAVIYAHQAAYLLFRGELLAGLDVDHLCHNADSDCPSDATCQHRRCVNPEHLELVPHRVNTLRGNGWMARRARSAVPGFAQRDVLV